MKLFDLIDLCSKFRLKQVTHDHWRIYAALAVIAMDEDQARVLADHIVDFRSRDTGDV